MVLCIAKGDFDANHVSSFVLFSAYLFGCPSLYIYLTLIVGALSIDDDARHKITSQLTLFNHSNHVA